MICCTSLVLLWCSGIPPLLVIYLSVSVSYTAPCGLVLRYLLYIWVRIVFQHLVSISSQFVIISRSGRHYMPKTGQTNGLFPLVFANLGT